MQEIRRIRDINGPELTILVLVVSVVLFGLWYFLGVSKNREDEVRPVVQNLVDFLVKKDAILTAKLEPTHRETLLNELKKARACLTVKELSHRTVFSHRSVSSSISHLADNYLVRLNGVDEDFVFTVRIAARELDYQVEKFEFRFACA